MTIELWMYSIPVMLFFIGVIVFIFFKLDKRDMERKDEQGKYGV